MKKQKIMFWLMLLVGIIAFVWMFAELGRVCLEVVNRSGVWSIPLDGVVQHKIGELMVSITLFLVLLLSYVWSKDRLFAFANRMQIVMIVGGLLNGLAWYSMRERADWDSFFRIWCLIILVVGLFGSQIAKWLVSKTKRIFNAN
jgi:hypothetical protein